MEIEQTRQYMIYSGCGNRFFILPFKTQEDFFSFRENQEELATLSKEAIAQKMDSVMVVVGNPTLKEVIGYHLSMYVFEPHAYDPSDPDVAWSTMCGNGIRAVAQYLLNQGITDEVMYIRSEAGIHQVTQLESDWRVNMGIFSSNRKDLIQYVSPNAVFTAETFGVSTRLVEPNVYVGFHHQKDVTLNGEPHAVLFTKKRHSSRRVRRLAKRYGKRITLHTDIFPQEINTSIVSILLRDEKNKRVVVRAATYERNIYYVTQACGTASTVIGALLYDRLDIPTDWQIEVHVPGGVLRIERNKAGEDFLIGEAKKGR